MTISRYFVLISGLLINLQVLSLNLLSLQCNNNFVTIRLGLILYLAYSPNVEHLTNLFEWIMSDSLLLGIQFYVV